MKYCLGHEITGTGNRHVFLSRCRTLVLPLRALGVHSLEMMRIVARGESNSAMTREGAN